MLTGSARNPAVHLKRGNRAAWATRLSATARVRPHLRLAGVCLMALGCCAAAAQDLAPLPEVHHRVIDTTGTLTADQSARLESQLAAFEQRKGSQVAVVIVPTTRPEAIEQYSIRLAEKLKVGRKNVDDGVILLLALQDHKVRIEVGNALEGPIPDSVADRIIREVMAPHFRAGDFYGGLSAGSAALMKLIDGEALPPPQDFQSAHRHNLSVGEVLLPGVVLVVILGGLLTALLGRVPGAALTGAIASGGAWILTGALVAVLLGALVGFIFPLVFGGTMGRGRGGGPGGGFPGGWGGGGWSSGGGTVGGGSSGSWSGGGGGFSGGGASGDW